MTDDTATRTERETACRCATQAAPCSYPPTQEDLLCDHCRAGCDLVRTGTDLTNVITSAGQDSVHVNNTADLDASVRINELLQRAASCGEPSMIWFGEQGSRYQLPRRRSWRRLWL